MERSFRGKTKNEWDEKRAARSDVCLTLVTRVPMLWNVWDWAITDWGDSATHPPAQWDLVSNPALGMTLPGEQGSFWLLHIAAKGTHPRGHKQRETTSATFRTCGAVLATPVGRNDN